MAGHLRWLPLPVWGVADQAFSAAASLLVTLMVARAATPDDFGTFALAQLLVIIVVQMMRQTVGTTLLTATDDRRGEISGGSTGVYVLVAAGGTGVLLAYAVGSTSQLAMALGLALSGLLVEERLRLEMHAIGRSDLASVASAIVCGAVALGMLVPAPEGWWTWPMVWYGGANAAVGVAGLLWGRMPVSLGETRRLFALEWRRWGSLFAVHAVTLGSWMLVPFVVTAQSGLAAGAGLRGAQTLTAIPQQIPQGLQSPFLRRWSWAGVDDTRTAARQRGRWYLIQLAIFVPILACFVVLPDSLGEALLGETWRYAEPLLPVVVLLGAVASMVLAADMQLRILQRTDVLLRIRTGMLPVVVAATIAGGAIGGPQSALVAYLATQVGTMALTVRRLRGLTPGSQ